MHANSLFSTLEKSYLCMKYAYYTAWKVLNFIINCRDCHFSHSTDPLYLPLNSIYHNAPEPPKPSRRPNIQAFENVIFHEKYIIFNNDDVNYTFKFMSPLKFSRRWHEFKGVFYIFVVENNILFIKNDVFKSLKVRPLLILGGNGPPKP